MEDLAAIRQCIGGDKDAFRHLVERYQTEAIGHAVAILGDRADAMDAVQEAFFDAFRALNRFDPGRRFYPWFYTILRNRCFKLAAARKRHEASGAEELEIFSASPSVSLEVVMSLERAVLELTPQQRELITLKHLDGLSYEELAEMLQVPIGTIMSRLYHARKQLRERLTRRFAVLRRVNRYE
ncbi:MAG TPA: RNA polymerase sigma factor [Blastocatellia bacterium]|nr:RNA polymerase sigma factor [Blastocatellia bacterium]